MELKKNIKNKNYKHNCTTTAVENIIQILPINLWTDIDMHVGIQSTEEP